MRTCRIAAALVWIACGALVLFAADSLAQTLFDRVQKNVATNLKRFPRYTCVQTIERSTFELPQTGATCATALASRQKNLKSRTLRWHDRLRLDVAVGERAEMVSWAGASRFEGGDVSDLVGRGASGSGEFGAFLTSVFAGDAQDFRYTGLRDTPLGRLAVFDYTVPLDKSHYQITTSLKELTTIAYRGSFFADPDSGDLNELDVQADLPAGDSVCSLSDTIEYKKTTIGDGAFMLPSRSTMDVIYKNSTESLNETTYSGCREYVGESTIRFDGDENGNLPEETKRAALRPLPPKTHLRVRIDPVLDARKAAAGDPIIGVIENQVKDRNDIIVHAGDKLHGRVVRWDQTLGNAPRWTVGIVFETIERGGVEQSISLRPTDDGDRSSGPQRGRNVLDRPTPGTSSDPARVPQDIRSERPAGGGIFAFSEPGNLILGGRFESEWETR